MIGRVEGEVVLVEERSAIVSAGGVGYVLFCPPRTLAILSIGAHTSLWTHLAVRDDALDLFGFHDRSDLRLFRALIGVSGIGPKSALNVLGLADTRTIVRAIASGDGAYLTKVSGVGKRLAEKIVLELRDRFQEEWPEESEEVREPEREAIDALEALGYAPRDTREIVRAIARECDRTEEIIRRSLQMLGNHS
jgi:Holliday junction DNA helicase RuvA